MSRHSLLRANEAAALEDVKLLVSNGVNVNDKEKNSIGWSPLHRASYHCYLEVARLLISKGADVNVRDESGWTPLHWASCRGHVKMVELLISHLRRENDFISSGKLTGSILGIVNERGDDGETPLHRASRRGHVKVVELLISYGADYSELMEYYYERREYEFHKKKREELERIVIDIGMSRVKMI
ncbi:MAG: ankyrin repeat domain-containing protein [Cycloclasticus sp.]|nr:ankyrin repeat domain-containing protein [Cycloclasticus sp.]